MDFNYSQKFLAVTLSLVLVVGISPAFAVTEDFQITASDAAANDQFGRSVSIDGNMAIVGVPNDDDGGSFSGSAYVFEKIAGVWTETAKLTASDTASSKSCPLA